MPHAREHRKAELIAEVRQALANGQPGLADFAGELYLRGAAEDLVAYTADELAAFAKAAFEDFEIHTPGTHRVTVSNPSFKAKGKMANEVTVIELVNDNMPFLVDSVMAELQDSRLEVHLVLHPIYSVARDAEGRLISAAGRKKAGTREDNEESLIHIHVGRIGTEEGRKALADRLNTIMNDARAAVTDWKPMRKRLTAAINTYKTAVVNGRDELWEAIHFLEWMANDNFIFLGMRDYTFNGSVEDGELTPIDGSGLGTLADPDVRVLRRGNEFVQITPEIREFLKRPDPLIIAKANVKSRVHRRVYMDYIGTKLFDDNGTMVGELRVVGLFASTAYNEPTGKIPFLRRKVASVLAKAGLDPDSHSGRALTNVMETFPRDELFQIDQETLFDFSMSILQLDERPRIRVLARAEKFDRYVSILCYIPRDRYTTEVRLNVGTYFASAFDGRLSAWYVTYPEGPLARVHFIIGRDKGKTPVVAQEDLERAVASIVRTWPDGLRDAFKEQFDVDTAHRLSERYALAFHGGYKEVYSAEMAMADVLKIETLSEERRTTITFARASASQAERLSLKVYNLGAPIPLSARVPLLENMGFRVINERTYRITPTDMSMSYLHEMTLEASRNGAFDLTANLKDRLEALFMAVWLGQAENDGYNALVLNAGLGWRDIAMLRALSKYLRQVGIRYSEDYMWTTLNNYPVIAAALVELFHIRFNPALSDSDRTLKTAKLEDELSSAFDAVVSLDDDRILRRFQNVIDATLRTNFFQLGSDGKPKPTFAFKINSRAIEDMPQPRPFREISVYSPRVEGIHLRFGKVARGGLRWSDRPQDFRTEVLGLVKAQQVKNAVIVPVGSKGGFVPKRLPVGGDREAVFAEGTEAYKIFIGSLLDVTDNLKGDTVLPPLEVVRHDEDDPYLVVAADKGTATFSDTANGISTSRDFWLGDAFASGGSAGYDHKKMAITARGAWEAVKRHFREMNRDIQREPFTVAGVGDMSGDVFGNGMLLSTEIRLVAAFDHRDIFLDPNPDTETSFAERQRLFNMGRSSWADYNSELISAGGGVFSRQLKSIPLSDEVQAMLGLHKAKATPQEVMTAILKLDVDLMWFGGIGTYIRASGETDADAGDRANDAIRITAKDVRAKVIGEGANLGMTQRARIEFGRKGGRSNSDAIDNSAGVNSSDMEVNIKIAFGAAVQAGKLDIPARNVILAEMTNEVAGLVLRNNYLQTLAISMTERRGMEDFGYQVRMMRQLESAGLLDRQVEYLPDDAAITELEKSGLGLTRPELGVLLAYAKITLYDALLGSDVPDDDYLSLELFRYFPDRMDVEFADEIRGHRLRREIIATMLANSMVNRGGPTFVTRIADQTGASEADIARCFVAVRNSFGLTALNEAIDALDARIDGELQLELYAEVQDLFLEQVLWFKRHVSFRDGIAAVVERFSDGIAALGGRLVDAVTPAQAEVLLGRVASYAARGIPEDLARRIAFLPVEATIPDIVLVAGDVGAPLDTAAKTFFEVAQHFRIGAMDAFARDLTISDYYDGLALDRARATLANAHRDLTAAAVKAGGFDNWLGAREAEVTRTTRAVGEILEGAISVSKFSVAASLLAEVAR
ncbi:NAD-glutamate dehydrogenase [Pannonibacter sp.]|uniref:NAD-glutamate dehydrogenase n=1 Tax=Pannonibacter sp. TaxID=1906786 RepID=UPI003F70DBFD